jgi:hypothetical protein
VERRGNILDGDEVIVDSTESAEYVSLRRSMLTDGVAPGVTGDYTIQELQVVLTNGEVVFTRALPFVYGLLSNPELSNMRSEQVEIPHLPVAKEGDTSFSRLGNGTS